MEEPQPRCDVRRIAFDVSNRVSPYLGVGRYESECVRLHALLENFSRARRRVPALGIKINQCRKDAVDEFKLFAGVNRPFKGQKCTFLLWGPPVDDGFAYWRGPMSEAPPGPVRVLRDATLSDDVYFWSTRGVQTECRVNNRPWLKDAQSQPAPTTLVESYSMTADGRRIAVPLNASRFFLSRLAGAFFDGDARWDDDALLCALALADQVYFVFKDFASEKSKALWERAHALRM